MREYAERRFGLFSLALVGVCICISFAQGFAQAQQPPEILAYADMVWYNGQILTADDAFTVAQAVAIRDGKFLAVGANERILAMAGPKTRRIDLAGKSVTPGFIDTHFHIHWYAERGVRPNILYRTRDQFLRELGEAVKSKSPGEWVFVTSSRTGDQTKENSVFGLTRKDLDPISPNNPVFIHTSPAGNDCLVNSYALRLAKIPPGTFGLETDPTTGEPNGQLGQVAYGIMYYETVPYQSIEALVPLYKAAMAKFNAGGMTTVLSRFPGETISIFKEIWQRGELTMRVRFAHEFARNAGAHAEGIIRRVGDLNGFGDEWMRISGANVGNPDGAMGSGRAWTRKPKLGTMDDFGFVPYFEDHEQSDWKTIVVLNRYGYRTLGIHTAGDRSVDELFTAYEAANKEKSLMGRGFAFDHTTMFRPEHIQTAKRLGLISSSNAIYIADPTQAIKEYGADEVFAMSPTRDLLKAGLTVSIESDNADQFWPMWNIEKFVTRKDKNGRVWNEPEKIDRKEALVMYTRGGSHYVGDEKLLGSIEPGKLADLVVLNGDFLAVPDDKISQLKVLMTVVGGKVVFEEKGALK